MMSTYRIKLLRPTVFKYTHSIKGLLLYILADLLHRNLCWYLTCDRIDRFTSIKEAGSQCVGSICNTFPRGNLPQSTTQIVAPVVLFVAVLMGVTYFLVWFCFWQIEQANGGGRWGYVTWALISVRRYMLPTNVNLYYYELAFVYVQRICVASEKCRSINLVGKRFWCGQTYKGNNVLLLWVVDKRFPCNLKGYHRPKLYKSTFKVKIWFQMYGDIAQDSFTRQTPSLETPCQISCRRHV